MHARLFVRVWICVCTRLCALVSVRGYMYVCVCVHVCMHVCMYVQVSENYERQLVAPDERHLGHELRSQMVDAEDALLEVRTWW